MHAANLVGIQRDMYREAVAGSFVPPPGMPDISLFRVKPHMDRIESAMEGLLQWYKGGMAKSASPMAVASPQPAGATAASATPLGVGAAPKGMASGKGMGMGGGKGVGGKAKAKAGKKKAGGKKKR